MGGSPHAEKPGGETGIAEVEFWGFDQALVEIGEPRADEEYEMAGL